MRTYNTLDELRRDLNDNGDLIVEDDIEIRVDVPAGVVQDIKAEGDITARDITAWDITAWDITAEGDITAWDITAEGDITARDISYNALCVAYGSITCRSWTGRRRNAPAPICMDGELVVTGAAKEAR